MALKASGTEQLDKLNKVDSQIKSNSNLRSPPCFNP